MLMNAADATSAMFFFLFQCVCTSLSYDPITSHESIQAVA